MSASWIAAAAHDNDDDGDDGNHDHVDGDDDAYVDDYYDDDDYYERGIEREKWGQVTAASAADIDAGNMYKYCLKSDTSASTENFKFNCKIEKDLTCYENRIPDFF